MPKVSFGNRATLSLQSGLLIALAAAAVASGLTLQARSSENGAVKNVVLVHGTNTDGSGWRVAQTRPSPSMSSSRRCRVIASHRRLRDWEQTYLPLRHNGRSR
jgi:hypothetical protein